MSKLQRLVMVQAGLRDLPVAYIIEGDGKLVVEASADNKTPFIMPSADGDPRRPRPGRCRC